VVVDTLTKADALSDPFALFDRWYADAVVSEPAMPQAMVVSTVDTAGWPASRTVYLRDRTPDGFVFYTNYESAKAREIEAGVPEGRAAGLFFWRTLLRQVRLVGTVARVDPALSDAYFAQRPRESQIGAWASPQSQVIADRAVLEANVAEYAARFANIPVPRPPHWGGYVIRPHLIEFWQGREARLHDRLRFRYQESAKSWAVDRLAP
jgi:pyridoxamine 5'-phosphate oxidase